MFVQTGEKPFHRANPSPSPSKMCSPGTAHSDLFSGAVSCPGCSSVPQGLRWTPGRAVELPGDPAPAGTWQCGRERLHQLDASDVSEVSACTCGEATWKTEWAGKTQVRTKQPLYSEQPCGTAQPLASSQPLLGNHSRELDLQRRNLLQAAGELPYCTSQRNQKFLSASSQK